jgi:prepilin-type N-terminal cleavage/methylation domain-containing protein
MIVKIRRTRHNPGAVQKRSSAFTLIELLVVIAIIAVLIGLLFPAFRAVQDQARKTQAKNDLTQIVNAVNAYYTEYGKYPLVTADTTYGAGGFAANNVLLDVLRGLDAANNPRQIVFITPPFVKDPANPRSGIGTPTGTGPGRYFDPWGTQYAVKIDGDYNNQLTNPYVADTGAGPSTLNVGVIAWSLGADQTLGVSGGKYKDPTAGQCDDVISWQ